MITRTMCRIALGLIIGAVAAPGLSARQEIERVTCDRGSCRQPLELVNGRSVTIGLTGEGLDALASGMVTDKSGRRIRGVAVELAPPGRPSRTRDVTTTRDVTVTAQGIAAALTGLELRFTTNARGTVTAPLDLSIAAAEQTRITRVSAETVRVEAGGAAIALTVEGVNLAAVTSARLLLDGRPVSDLVSELARPARSTTDQRGGQLVVELAAGPSVPAGDYQLELMAGRQRIVVPAPITVVQSVAGAIAAAAPSVTAATPETIELLAGGPPRTITLNGANLDKVATAYVTRNGNRVFGIGGNTQPTTDPGRLEIQMQASANSAGMPLDVPLELVLVSSDGTATPIPFHVGVTEAASQPSTATVTAYLRITTPQLHMTGLRFPIEIETQMLRMIGLRFPTRVVTQELTMTGIREEEQ